METLMPEMARSTHDTMNTMATTGRAFAGTTSTAPAPTAIHTTLYNLIVALSAEVGPDDEDVVTATVIHLLQTYRVTGTGTLEGYRLVCDGAERLARTVPSEEALLPETMLAPARALCPCQAKASALCPSEASGVHGQTRLRQPLPCVPSPTPTEGI